MSTPPRLAQWLLARLVPAELREGVLGDLHQLFVADAERLGPARARLKYWLEVVRSAPAFAGEQIPRGRLEVQLAVTAVVAAVAARQAARQFGGGGGLWMVVFGAGCALAAVQIWRQDTPSFSARFGLACRMVYLMLVTVLLLEMLRIYPAPPVALRLGLALVIPLLFAVPIAAVLATFSARGALRFLPLAFVPLVCLLLLWIYRTSGGSLADARPVFAIGLPFSLGLGDPSWRLWNLALDLVAWISVALASWTIGRRRVKCDGL